MFKNACFSVLLTKVIMFDLPGEVVWDFKAKFAVVSFAICIWALLQVYDSAIRDLKKYLRKQRMSNK